MRYSWDPEKNRRNFAKHRIDFATAVEIFDGPTVERHDDRYDYGEVRILATGIVRGRVVSVIYTDWSEDERRIISARKASHGEERIFWQAVPR
jgi:uncharacterized protein